MSPAPIEKMEEKKLDPRESPFFQKPSTEEREEEVKEENDEAPITI